MPMKSLPRRSIDSFLRFMGLVDTHQKGNKGRGAARRRLFFLSIVLLVSLVFLGIVHVSLPSSAAGNHSRVMRHAKASLRRARSAASVAKQQQPQYTREEQKEFILSGQLNLIEIHVVRQELDKAPSDSYDGVYGTFCRLNFAAHKADPSGVPMFRDLVEKSPMCAEDFEDDTEEGDDDQSIPRGRIQVNLKHLADMAREADEQQLYPKAKNLALTGVAFHESRCGSTLVANSLIGMNPAKHRVYSESAPPIAALGICGEHYEFCELDQAAQILRDVMYFMGRSQDAQEERVFYKIQSAGTRSLEVFRKAFPKTPWLFVYRDPVQVMMSHFAKGTKSANCLRSMHSPPRILRELARRRGYAVVGGGGGRHKSDDENDGLKDLMPPDFCAAHLATLTETAVDHIHQSGGLGRAVNYVNLPHILYEEILPSWGVSVSETEVQNIQTVSGKYSKGRGEKKEFKEDSEQKEKMASPEIKQASKIFLQDSYNELEKLAAAQNKVASS